METTTKTVSIIVLSYNPKWEKLKKTVLSAIFQKGIDFEIIISDDGSKNTFFSELEALFKKYNFIDYKLIHSGINKGTTCNLFAAIEVAKGKYIKDISPGDYLYTENIVADWISYMKRNNFSVCFGKAVYYNDDHGFAIIKHRTAPKYIRAYRNQNSRTLRREYLLLDDNALGAAYVCDKQILHDYLSLMIGKVRLGEDYVYSLMVFAGVPLNLYDRNVVWYEFGNGVSTSKDPKYTKDILRDWDNMHNAMLEIKSIDAFATRFKCYINAYNRMPNSISKRLIRYVFLPETIWWRIVLRYTVDYSDTSYDSSFYNLINEDKS